MKFKLTAIRAQEIWIEELQTYAREIRVPYSRLLKFAGSRTVETLRATRTPAEARAIVLKHESELNAAQAEAEILAVENQNPGLSQEVEMAL